MSPALFLIFSVLLLASALGVILLENPVHAALSLILAFFCTSALWLMMHAEYLALLLIVLYVGAVMVLFLFVVMMFRIDYEKTRLTLKRSLLFFLAVLIVIVGEIMVGVAGTQFPYMGKAPLPAANLVALGHLLFSHYLFGFELAGVVLLLGVMVVAVLTLRSEPRLGVRRQSVPDQLAASPRDRLRILSDADLPHLPAASSPQKEI